MAPSSSTIEQAVHYAQLKGNLIETNSRLDRDQKREEYVRLLDQVDSPQNVAELQLRFEEDKPYFQLCDDKAIASYFSRWKVPITTKSDLDLFSDALAEKVTALALYDEKVRAQLEQRDYRKQLRELPAALSNLEQAISEYDTLKLPFKAVMRYAWEAISLDGFKMEEDGSKAIEQYPGHISIQPYYNKSVHMKIVLDNDDTFRVYIKPRYKTRVVAPAKKRKFWFDAKEKVEETEEIETIEILPMNFFNTVYNNNSSYCLEKGRLDSKIFKIPPESILDLLKEITIKNFDRYETSFQTFLQIILSLPKFMNNHASRKTESMKSILQRVSKQTNDSSCF